MNLRVHGHANLGKITVDGERGGLPSGETVCAFAHPLLHKSMEYPKAMVL